MNRFEFRPVGQGLFYTGSLDNYHYNFVYDCGTENRSKNIEKEIDAFASEASRGSTIKPTLDFVVISHLHTDHYSGLFYLFKKFNIRRIYLPYLGDIRHARNLIRAALAYTIFVEGAEKETLSDDLSKFKDLLSEKDTSYSFSEEDRVASNKLFLFHFMLALYGEGRDAFPLLRETEIVYNNRGQVVSESDDYIISSSESSSEEFYNDYNDYNDYWFFKFINSYATPNQLLLLSRNVAKITAKQSLEKLLAKKSTGPAVLKRIKSLYESIFGKSNLLNQTSIVMLHYPRFDNATVLYCQDVYKYNLCRFSSRCCLYCYDGLFFNCRQPRRGKNVYSVLSGDIMFNPTITHELTQGLASNQFFLLQIPHHGSKDNWQSVTKNGISANVYVLPFGYGNKHKLPSTFTIDDLMDNHCEYYNATQDSNFIYFIT